MKTDIISYMAYSVELVVSIYIWPLYLGAYVLASKTVYAKLGILASVSVFAAMLSAFTIGKLVDKSQGRKLLRAGTIVNAALHLARPFVASYPTAFVVNAANEGISVTYQLPYSKGMYDAADDHSSHRINYFVVMEMVSSFARMSLCILLILLTLLITEKDVIKTGFVIGALTSLLIMTERFKALNR